MNGLTVSTVIALLQDMTEEERALAVRLISKKQEARELRLREICRSLEPQ